MEEKIRNYRHKINSVILAGVFLFFIGLYYWMIRAGIPYQDPSIELQIQYAVDMKVGTVLLRNGFVIMIGGGIIRLFLGLLLKRYLKK